MANGRMEWGRNARAGFSGGVTIKERWLEWEEGRSFRYEGHGIPSVANAANRWTVELHGHQTLLTSESEVRLKGGAISRPFSPLLSRQIDRDASGPHGLRVLRRARPASARQALAAPGRPSRLLSGALRERCFPSRRSKWNPRRRVVRLRYFTTGGGRAAPPRCGCRPATRDRPLPGRRHDRSPPGAERPEVGAQLAAILERRLTPAGAQLVALDDVRTGPLTSRNETDRGRSKRTVSTVVTVRPGATGREVRGEDQIGAALDHLQLAPQRARRPAEVRRGDDVEHDSGGAAMFSAIGPSGRKPAADAEVERQPGARDKRSPRGEQGTGDGGAQRKRHSFVLHGWDTPRVAARAPAHSDPVDLSFCGAGLDAELIERDGRVILRRECPEHGLLEALVYGDSERWRDGSATTGRAPSRCCARPRPTGCPSDCGICPEHAQHTCLGIIEVNTGCNLDCPVLLRRVGHRASAGRLLAVAGPGRVDARRVRRRRGGARGGPALGRRAVDPPADPRDAARGEGRGIPLVMLNTNGIRLARDPHFAPALAELGIHVYLQFDGFATRPTWRSAAGGLQEIKQARAGSLCRRRRRRLAGRGR